MKKKIISLALASIMCFTAVMGNYMVSDAVGEDDSTTTTGSQNTDTEGLNISKYVTYSKDDEGVYSYTLSLESFTTGTISQDTVETTPADIVLVLDQSTSMLWPVSDDSNKTGDTNQGIIDGYYVTDEGDYVFDEDGNLIWITYLTDQMTLNNYIESVELSSYDGVNNDTVYENDGSFYQYISTLETNGFLYSESRQKVLIDSVATFIHNLDTTAGHQVSIVTFHNTAEEVYSFTDTANSPDGNGVYDYTDIIDEVVGWVNADNGTDYSTSYMSGRYTFNLQHSTLTALGVEEAESILDELGDNDDICVIFTDGIPTNLEETGIGTADGDIEYNVTRALESAYTMKVDDVTVFTIGMLGGVTESVDENGYSDYQVDDSNDLDTEGVSAFLDFMSSNYLEATDITESYKKQTITDDEGNTDYTNYYYPLNTSDASSVADDLANIFETVQGALASTATINLDETTQIRDVMTQDFSIPTDADASNITVSIAYATGISGDVTDLTTNDSEYYTWSDATEIYENGTAVEGWSGLTVALENITVYEPNYDSDGNILYNEDGTISYSEDSYSTQQVVVEGFDYNYYHVATEPRVGDYTGNTDGMNADLTNFYGAKLIISFEIEPESEVLDVVVDDDETTDDGYSTIGGNGIETNHVTSGIYIYDEATLSYSSLESFPVPTADISIDLEFSVTDQTIYLGNSISVADLLQIDGHAIMGEANKYVDITFSIYSDINGDGTVSIDADPLLTVDIDAGESMSSAVEGLYDSYSLITPSTTTEYIVTIYIEPILEDGSVEAYYAESEEFSVYVLNPTILANDTWVDYATPVNLREDNIIQVITEDTEAFDAVRVSWETAESYTDENGDPVEIPEPNEDIPPTVTFGFTARRGIEYTAAEFEEYGIREDKEFEITSMTVVSSDGYNNTTIFDLDAYEEAELTSFSVNVNRFDLVISKTVEADVYDSYPQSFIFDIEYTGTEFVTEETIYTDSYGFAIFSRESNSSSTVKLYVDMTDYDDDGGTGSYTIYTNVAPDDTYEKDEVTSYYNITSLFVTVDDEGKVTMNDSDSANWIDIDTFTIYYGSAPITETTPDVDTDDGFISTAVNKVAEIKDITKNIEVVIDPDMSNVKKETSEVDGVNYYTFSTTITDLYCGIEMIVTEETDWSWRYEPTFSVETINTTYDDNSTGETVTTTTNTDGDTTQVTTATINGYKIADFDEIHSGDATLGSVTDLDTGYDYYLTTYEFESISTITINKDADTAVILVSNSEGYLDKGDDESYSDWTRLTELTYFGSELYTAELIGFDSDTITYKSSAPGSSGNTIVLSGVYYYNESGEQVYQVLADENDSSELAENTYYITDEDGVESIAFSIVEIPKTVPAVYFDTADVELDVTNTLEVDKDKWLSDSSLIENFYSLYSYSSDSTYPDND